MSELTTYLGFDVVLLGVHVMNETHRPVLAFKANETDPLVLKWAKAQPTSNHQHTWHVVTESDKGWHEFS